MPGRFAFNNPRKKKFIFLPKNIRHDGWHRATNSVRISINLKPVLE